MSTQITILSIEHKGKNRIRLIFEKNEAFTLLLRNSFKDLKWSSSLKSWHVPHTLHSKKTLFLICKEDYWLDYSNFIPIELKPVVKTISSIGKAHLLPKITNEIEGLISIYKNHLTAKRYSESTVKSYEEALRTFLRFTHEKAISDISNLDIIKFNNEYILKNNFSESFQNQVINSIKLFFQVVHNKKIDVDAIERPRREKKLPNVLSKEEVKLLLGSLTNTKHKTMLSLIYSCGLRSGELLKLKPQHIDSNRNILIVYQSKGKKDRIVPLSNKTIEMLRSYYTAYKPSVYLFEGEFKGSPYHERSLQKVIKNATLKAKINKPVTLHWLRHSYATHLLEAGTDLRYIQEILGHSSSRTTEIYTHVSTKSIQQIKSPFDDL